jgi:hypothetical protein
LNELLAPCPGVIGYGVKHAYQKRFGDGAGFLNCRIGIEELHVTRVQE